MTNYEFVDLDGDGIKEIVGERSYCQILLRDGTWEEQFCEPYESETHRYNGVKYGKDLVEEKSPAAMTS